MPGHSDTTAPPLLDRQQTDLLEALPPVVTGVDVDNVFEGWQRSSLLVKGPTRRGEGEPNSVGSPGSTDQGGGDAVEDPLDGSRNVLANVDLSSGYNAAAVEVVVETRLPSVAVDLDGVSSTEILPACSSAEEGDTTARPAATAGSTFGVGMGEIRSDGGSEIPTTTTGLPRTEEGAAAAGEEAEAGDTAPGYLEAYAPPSGVGLTRLCRRAVILLTRSPACPDLVAWQTHPAEKRTYDQMEPLLARANMTHKDLYPRLVGLSSLLVRNAYQVEDSLVVPLCRLPALFDQHARRAVDAVYLRRGTWWFSISAWWRKLDWRSHDLGLAVF